MSALDPTLDTGTYHDFHGLTRLRAEAGQQTEGSIKATAQQFEAYFIQEMMKSMRKTVEKSDLIDDGKTEFYEEMMDKELSIQMAKRGSLGLGNMLVSQLQKQPSTQDVLQQKKDGFTLDKTREPMSLNPVAAKAFLLDNKVKP